jgi:DNA-binding response OmpR family regulator
MPKDLIVVADDDRVIVALVADALRKAGFNVFPAFDSMQAMLGTRQNPKAIVLDVAMPGGSGMDVLRKLKSMNKLSQIPIIVLTGSTDPAMRDQALSAGAEDFLTKPVDIPALVSAVRKAVGQPEPPAAQ